MSAQDSIFNDAAGQAVELGNQLADRHPDADLWDLADGLLAGAVHYWLYACKPCEDPACEDCAPLATPEGRVKELKKLVEQFATESEYFHSPDDLLSGRA